MLCLLLFVSVVSGTIAGGEFICASPPPPSLMLITSLFDVYETKMAPPDPRSLALAPRRGIHFPFCFFVSLPFSWYMPGLGWHAVHTPHRIWREVGCWLGV